MYFWTRMKTKFTFIFFLLLSIFFLHKIDKNHFHSCQYAVNYNAIVNNNLSSNLTINNLQDNSDSKFLQNLIQDNQIDEEEESLTAENFFVVVKNELSSLITAVYTHHYSKNYASVLETYSSKKYILFSVFRI